jgi:hypothetical protein
MRRAQLRSYPSEIKKTHNLLDQFPQNAGVIYLYIKFFLFIGFFYKT